MIEQLENCPNCGGILDEAGRCKFCGTKVYDFLNIAFSDPHAYSSKTYIRIKTREGKIMVAPVVVRDCTMTMRSDIDYLLPESGYSYLTRKFPTTEIDLGLLVTGDFVYTEADNETIN